MSAESEERATAYVRFERFLVAGVHDMPMSANMNRDVVVTDHLLEEHTYRSL